MHRRYILAAMVLSALVVTGAQPSQAQSKPPVSPVVVSTSEPSSAAATIKPSRSPSAAAVPSVSPPTATSTAGTAKPPDPKSMHVYKEGECPLTKDSSGVWHTPDGKTVDAALAKMGDCK